MIYYILYLIVYKFQINLPIISHISYFTYYIYYVLYIIYLI